MATAGHGEHREGLNSLTALCVLCALRWLSIRLKIAVIRLKIAVRGKGRLTSGREPFHDSAMTKTPYDKTFERALNLLSYKPRSLAEMRSRLMEKDWAEEAVVDQVLVRLEELGYLNDEEFAANFANSR